ncbi:hypothetical protein [Rariglobus hedericola]|uniref:Uncharacterized protein n=1 Tax=Rariglobus hedericola TaxID=2597822 RepID=A0A556QRV3_9BACT|nr:hypothetical protein [Rariglobus hedericola]TSJ79377.1 hypothetical protein FPL22_08835 [Rariglobus hedericola]
MDIDFEKFRHLDGCNVLVKPARPDDQNAVGLRGTIRVHELPTNQGIVKIEIVVSYPERSDMNGRPAHEEIIPLSHTDVMRLLNSEIGDTRVYEFTLDDGGRSVP